jgi:hypothetical protein
MKALRSRNRGFTFLEMALALFVMGFLFAALPRLLIQTTTASLAAPGAAPEDAIKLALTGFIVRHSRLPCPAASPLTGTEDCTRAKGFVPYVSLGLAKPATNDNGLPFAYAIWTDAANNNHLGQVTSKYTPRYFNSTDSGGVAAPHYWDDPIPTLTSNEQNGLDFCAKLRHASTLAAQPALTAVKNVRIPAQPINVAFVLADPGTSNADGAGATYPEFDGANHPTTPGLLFESPSAPESPTYNDKVTADSFTQLFGELKCPELLANVSAAAREANFANENWRVRMFMKDLRDYEQTVRHQKVIQAQNSVAVATFNVALGVAITGLDLGVGLAGAAGAAAIAVLSITAVTTVAMAAYGLVDAGLGLTDAQNEEAEGLLRVADAVAAVTAAATFRAQRQASLILIDQRGWFE